MLKVPIPFKAFFLCFLQSTAVDYIPPSLSKELAVKANEILGNEVYVPSVHDPEVYHISTPQVVVLAMDQVRVSVSK